MRRLGGNKKKILGDTIIKDNSAYVPILFYLQYPKSALIKINYSIFLSLLRLAAISLPNKRVS
jgi:tryptophan-rich sensory protein